MGELVAALSSVTGETIDSYKLDVILGKLKDDGMNASAQIISTNFLNNCKQLLQSEKFASKDRLAEILAELAKFECSREPCVTAGLIPEIIQLIEASGSSAGQYQGLRALGNICYENTLGKKAVLDADGCRILTGMVKHVSSVDFEQLKFAKLPLITIGCLWNVSDGFNDIQKEVISLDVIPSLEALLIKHLEKSHTEEEEDDGFIYLLLSLLSSLTDIEEGNTAVCESNIPVKLMTLLRCSEGGVKDITDDTLTVLEIIKATIEHEKARCAIVDSEFLPTLLSLLSTVEHDTENVDSENVERLVTDVIVLAVGFDDTLHTLYHDGHSTLLDEILTTWLPSGRCQLQVSGALAIGNFARSDETCVSLVSGGFLEPLLNLLKSSDSRDSEESVKIQESTLSTLRNLAIPVLNKVKMLDESIISLVLPYLASSVTTVRYKVLAILRMVIERQEDAAKCLGCMFDTVKLIVQYSSSPVSPGEMGEASRLLASLVRNSKSSEVMDIIVQCEGATPIITMVSSQHPIMQNEAIVAMAILCTVNLASLEETILGSELVTVLGEYLKNQEHGTELKMNALSLVNEMRRSEPVKVAMLSNNILDILSSLVTDSNNTPHVRQRATSVSQSF